jgi:hypothetical protein
MSQLRAIAICLAIELRALQHDSIGQLYLAVAVADYRRRAKFHPAIPIVQRQPQGNGLANGQQLSNGATSSTTSSIKSTNSKSSRNHEKATAQSFREILRNHFIAGRNFGIGVWLAMGYYCNARFDGVIDLHFVKAVGAYEPLLDLLVTVIVTSILMFSLGKYRNPKTRLIDLFNTVLIAKIPFYLLTVFNSTGMIFNASEKVMKSVQENVLNLPDFFGLVPDFDFQPYYACSLGALCCTVVSGL